LRAFFKSWVAKVGEFGYSGQKITGKI
jgi:hypothetical protein